jgi:hypothetical protein
MVAWTKQPLDWAPGTVSLRFPSLGAWHRLSWDESLASTPAGREWIALAESILSEVGLVLLEDRELSQEAAGLLEIATKRLQDERTPLTGDEVARAQELIKRVASKSESRQLQSDLQTVSDALARMEGLTITDALETLTRQSPVGDSNEQGA